MTKLEQKVAALGAHFVFGGGQAVAVNDPVLLLLSAAPKVAVVQQVGVVISSGGNYDFGIRVRVAGSNVGLPRFYKDYGKTWTITVVPPVADAGSASTMFSMTGNWRSMASVGAPLNTGATNPSVTPIGFGTTSSTGKLYNQRGHLIANRLWGPSNDLRNIEAMHYTSNQGKMKILENAIATTIIKSGDIFRIEAQALPAGAHPPDWIELRITKIFPLPVGSPTLIGTVDNR